MKTMTFPSLYNTYMFGLIGCVFLLHLYTVKEVSRSMGHSEYNCKQVTGDSCMSKVYGTANQGRLKHKGK